MSFIIRFTAGITYSIKNIIYAESLGQTKREAILNNYGEKAVARDWKTVGQDISTSMKRYELEQGTRK